MGADLREALFEDANMEGTRLEGTAGLTQQ
jgi:hypothetical protein